MTNSITVTQPTQLSAKQTEQLRAIYLDSFPSYERADFSYLLNSIARGARWCFTAMQDDEMLGMAIIVPHVASDIHLLEYLAVSNQVRGRGIGGRLLDEVITAIRTRPGTLGLLIEVEPADEGNEAERHLRARRLEFYRRHGARLVEGAPDYYVPMADREGTLRMILLWLPFTASARVPAGAQWSECILNIYARSYELPRQHPLVREISEHSNSAPT